MEEYFSGQYEGPIIDALRYRFVQDRNSEIPQNQHIYVMYTMLREDALRYFTDHILPHKSSVDEAFGKFQKNFMTPALRNTYTTKFNTFTVADLQKK